MDVVQVIQAMNRAQASLSKATREEKQSGLQKFFADVLRRLESERENLAIEIVHDIGMPLRYARTRSVPAAIEIVRETAALFERESLSHQVPPNGHAAVFLGWTDPIVSFCRRVPAILASGNAVCVKPSSRAPRAVWRISQIFRDALEASGLPLGLFAVLNGRGEGEDFVGHALLEHPGFKTIYWIGRTDSALLARDLANRNGKRFHFVGSGRNPAILFQGFDEAVSSDIIRKWARVIADPHGFGPYRLSRLFVQESIYKPTMESLAEELKSLKTGDPLSEQTEVGLLPHREIANFETQVRLALKESGHLVTGGNFEGTCAAPTLIRDLTNCSTLQSEELAGPWATIASFKYQHEALKYANTSPLGLASYVLHPDSIKAEGVADKLESSRVFFAAEPAWPLALHASSEATKQSANARDGIFEIYKFGQWRATRFVKDSSGALCVNELTTLR